MATKKNHPNVPDSAPVALAPAAPPAPAPTRLLGRKELLATVNRSYPRVWQLMIARQFPRARVVGGKSLWRSDEVQRWIDSLPERRLKGDDVETPEAA